MKNNMISKNICYIFVCILSLNSYIFAMESNTVNDNAVAQQMLRNIKTFLVKKDNNHGNWNSVSENSKDIISSLNIDHFKDIRNLFSQKDFLLIFLSQRIQVLPMTI